MKEKMPSLDPNTVSVKAKPKENPGAQGIRATRARCRGRKLFFCSSRASSEASSGGFVRGFAGGFVGGFAGFLVGPGVLVYLVGNIPKSYGCTIVGSFIGRFVGTFVGRGSLPLRRF